MTKQKLIKNETQKDVDLGRIVRNLLRWKTELRNVGELHLSDHVDTCVSQAAAYLASAAEDLEERLGKEKKGG